MVTQHNIYPTVEKLGKRKWKLTKSFHNVPAGFETDGASVPRLLWAILDPATEAFEAAIIHDYNLLYDNSKYKISSHKLFRIMLIEYNVRIWKAYVAYIAVCCYWFIRGNLK